MPFNNTRSNVTNLQRQEKYFFSQPPALKSHFKLSLLPLTPPQLLLITHEGPTDQARSLQ